MTIAGRPRNYLAKAALAIVFIRGLSSIFTNACHVMSLAMPSTTLELPPPIIFPTKPQLQEMISRAVQALWLVAVKQRDMPNLS